MLPQGFAADLVDPEDQREVRRRFPGSQVAVRLTHGACSCDVVVARHPVTREDEALLRRRYRALGLSRDDIIRALERHRRAAELPHRKRDPCQVRLAGFVAEHARNAGESWYLLRFTPTGRPDAATAPEPVLKSVAQVRANPSEWLAENQPIVVTPMPV